MITIWKQRCDMWNVDAIKSAAAAASERPIGRRMTPPLSRAMEARVRVRRMNVLHVHGCAHSYQYACKCVSVYD